MEKISVIIPVYNGEKFLKQCLNSVVSQSYSHLEIIIVNDGSSDRTALIAEQIKAQDSRIRILHKKQNEGIGAARNSGLSMATGEYIVFIDSDDWIDANHISDLYELILRTESDVAVTNFTRYYNATGKYEIHITAEDYYEAVYTPQEWFSFQYGRGQNMSLCFTVPWCKLYKKALFETVSYHTQGYGDDDYTTWKLYLMADKISYMHRSSYLYRVNGESLTQVNDLSTVFSIGPVAERLEVLSLLGMDVSREITAYKWRLQINRDAALAKGDVDTYKNLEYRMKLIEKYGDLR